MKTELTTFTFHSKMNTDSVSKYFPADDNETIMRFMEQDENFDARRHGFYELLKTTEAKTAKKFSESLIKALFTVRYKSYTRWPCSR